MLLTDRVKVSIECHRSVAYQGILISGEEGSENLVEGRGNREVPLKFQISETRILIMFFMDVFHGTGN
jgi:hypothetical protein